MSDHAQKPEARSAQKTLAQHVTRLVRGDHGLRQALLASRILFGGEPLDTVVNEVARESTEEGQDDLAEVFAGCGPVSMSKQQVRLRRSSLFAFFCHSNPFCNALAGFDTRYISNLQNIWCVLLHSCIDILN